jgi:hypothetical protein
MIFPKKIDNPMKRDAIIYYNFYCFRISSLLIFTTAMNHDLSFLFLIWFFFIALFPNFIGWLYEYDCVINFIILCCEILLVMYNMLLHLGCLFYIILMESSLMTMMRLPIILFLIIRCLIVFIFTGWRYCDYL